MLTHDYAQAVRELLEEGKSVDSVLVNLRARLVRKGHERLLPLILKELLRELVLREQQKRPQVRVAHAHKRDDEKKLIVDLLAKLGGKSEYTVIVDETLIGGAVVEYQNRVVDASYKKHLHELYQALTT